MNHQHRWQLLAAGTGRAGQVALDRAAVSGRGVSGSFDVEPGVIGWHLLAGSEVRAQRGEQTGNCHANLGKLSRLRKKAAPVQLAVDIGVKEDQYILVKVMGGKA